MILKLKKRDLKYQIKRI